MALGISEDQTLELYDIYRVKAKMAYDSATRAALSYLKSSASKDQEEGMRYLREGALWDEALTLLQKARCRG